MTDKGCWIFLQLGLGVGAKIVPIQGFFGSAREAVESGEDEWRKCPYIDSKQLERLCRVSEDEVEKIIYECEKNSWEIITPDCQNYPSGFLNMSECPAVIYVDGDSSCLEGRLTAISGTRSLSERGAADNLKTVGELYGNSRRILSGATSGCDLTALQNVPENEKAVALTAWGLGTAPDKLTGQQLMRTARGGAVVSEYPVYRCATLPAYHRRNRLMAAVCDSLVVIEAGEKSGALSVASQFIKAERAVYALPGSVGCDLLLRKGAAVWRGNVEITQNSSQKEPLLQQGHENNSKTEINLDNLSQNAIIVYNILKTETGTFDFETAIGKSGLTPTQAVCALTELELMGIVGSDSRGHRRIMY